MFLVPLLLLFVVASCANSYPTGIPSSHPPSHPCVADVVLLVDNAGSGPGDEMLVREKDALQELLDVMPVSDSSVRMAVISFSTEVTQVLDLQQGNTTQAVVRAVDSVTLGPAGRNGDGAIREALQLLQTQGRADVSQTIIYVTAGLPDNPATALQEAQKAKDQFVDIMVWAVDDTVNVTALRKLAKRPYFPFVISSYRELQTFLSLARQNCGNEPTYGPVLAEGYF